MALLGQNTSELKNKYCSLKNLKNEPDVRELFLTPLLKELGYTEDYRETEHIPETKIDKGKKRKLYKPDYICYTDKNHAIPVLVIDTKSPTENAEEGVEDAQLYTSIIRRRLEEPKPIQYCIGSNAVRTIIKHFDSDKIEFDLSFSDFEDGNTKFEALKDKMSRSSRAKAITQTTEPFEFRKPDLREVTGIFEACHNIIRRKDGMGPEPAFYEFTKIMFIKINEDKKLRKDPEIKKLLDSEMPLPPDKVIFSIHWIMQNSYPEPNPVNSTLFRLLRESLELEIIEKKKKRIFDVGEQIDLKPETIREIVKLLEHLDLFAIDEDLNGSLFQTFLSATMRGEQLGQFFTPRTVVEFMTEMADLKADFSHIDRVFDGCCGTGGFLIEAMAFLERKIRENHALNGKEKAELIDKIQKGYLFGIDFGRKPPIARIARINMYLHGDGGSRIYFADALDKNLLLDETLQPEVFNERTELKEFLANNKFDVVMTNPPFATPYKNKDSDQGRILRQYNLAHHLGKDKTLKMRASLETNVMFIERYCDLLKDEGKLLMVIDESVLNTDTDKSIRTFILNNFFVKAIISLPRGTFKRAGANVKTSILYLVKKKQLNEEQPHTFYAKSKNTGFDPENVQKLDITKSDLKPIIDKWHEYLKSGEI